MQVSPAQRAGRENLTMTTEIFKRGLSHEEQSNLPSSSWELHVDIVEISGVQMQKHRETAPLDRRQLLVLALHNSQLATVTKCNFAARARLCRPVLEDFNTLPLRTDAKHSIASTSSRR